VAIRKEPRLAEWVREFVIMGGSTGRGNVTPAAEFNLWADPEAASVVFSAGWTVRMIGLDVTLQALAVPSVKRRMAGLGELADTLLLPALNQYSALADPAVHDVCAVASIAVPEIFGYTPAQVQVETTGRLTSGMSVTDFSPVLPHNAQVATKIDTELFWDVVLGAYARLAPAMH
jgi:purine nucleosidase